MSRPSTALGDMLPHHFPLPPDDVLARRETEAREAAVAASIEAARETRRKNLNTSRPPVDADDVDRLIASALTTTRSLQAVEGFVGDSKAVLLLTGTIGVGKTVAAAWMLANHGGEYIRAERACGVFTARFGPQAEEQDRLKRVGRLVVDEIGTERDPVLMGSVLLELIDERRWRGQKTILICNLELPDVKARYPDERLWSRLRQCGVLCGDKSRDLRRAAP